MNEVNPEFFNWLDYLYLTLLFCSALVGLVRGFIKDFFSTFSWFFSGYFAVFIAPYVAPKISGRIENVMIARCLSVLIAFILCLTVLVFTSNLISKTVKATFFSGVDRAWGILFGLFRGFALLLCGCILLLMFDFAPSKHEIIMESKLSVMLFDFAQTIMPRVMEMQFVRPLHLDNFRDKMKNEGEIFEPQIKQQNEKGAESIDKVMKVNGQNEDLNELIIYE